MECVPPVGSVVQSRVRIQSRGQGCLKPRDKLSRDPLHCHVTVTWRSCDWFFIGIFVQFEYDWLQVLSYRHVLSGNIMLSSGKIFFGTDWYSRTSMPNESSWSSIRVTLSKYCFIPLDIVKIVKFQAEIAKIVKNGFVWNVKKCKVVIWWQGRKRIVKNLSKNKIILPLKIHYR